MPSFGPMRAGVVGAMAQLAHVFDHHLHAMGVAFRQMAAGEIARQFVIDLKPAALDEISCLTAPAEAVRFELNQRSERECVVPRDKVDIAVADSRDSECTFPSAITPH